MTKLSPLIIFIALLLSPHDLFAQKVPSIVTNLEKVFEEKEPSWEIDRQHVQTSPPVTHLKSKQGGDVLIYFWLMNSEKDAKDVMDGNIIALKNQFGKKLKETQLAGFGDYNDLLSYESGGFANFEFRKGKVYISVVARAETTAKKFAGYVIKEINMPQDR